MIRVTTNDDGLKNSVVVSAGLHLFFLLFLYFGLPHIFKPLPEHHDPVPFQIVEMSELTNTRLEEKQPTPPQPAPAPPPKPVEQSHAAPSPQPMPQPQEPPVPTPPAKPVEPKPEEKAEALKPLPKPQVKPKPPEAAKPQQDMLASVLKDVAKLKPAEQQVKAPETKTDVKSTQPEAQSQAPSLSQRLTISEEDALRRQIQQCWNMPIGARDAQNLIVEIMIDVNPDRTVQHVEIVDKSRFASDPFFRTAAEAAQRAVLSPRCTPLDLPPEKYEQWKHIDFTFDPRDML